VELDLLHLTSFFISYKIKFYIKKTLQIYFTINKKNVELVGKLYFYPCLTLNMNTFSVFLFNLIFI